MLSHMFPSDLSRRMSGAREEEGPWKAIWVAISTWYSKTFCVWEEISFGTLKRCFLKAWGTTLRKEGKIVRWQNMIGLCVQKCVVPLGTDGSSLASMWHETIFLQIGLTHATRRIKHSACTHWSFIHYMWAKAPNLWHLLLVPSDFTYKIQIKR